VCSGHLRGGFALPASPEGLEGPQPHSSSPETDDEEYNKAVLRFVERFALVLTEVGLHRMAARVFAYVLAEDAEVYTARDLAEGLRVSPAAVSGAVRLLVQGGLLAKERAPGARVDHYRVYDNDVWSAIFSQRITIIERYEEVLVDGVKSLGRDRPGGRRIEETLEFFRFVHQDQSRFLERWQEHRKNWLNERHEHQGGSDRSDM
jgi:DNA-binding transcriptional regulator GbsR (MarR family)